MSKDWKCLTIYHPGNVRCLQTNIQQDAMMWTLTINHKVKYLIFIANTAGKISEVEITFSSIKKTTAHWTYLLLWLRKDSLSRPENNSSISDDVGGLLLMPRLQPFFVWTFYNACVCTH